MKIILIFPLCLLTLYSFAQECSVLDINNSIDRPWSVATGDLDQDGDIDLVSGSSSNLPGLVVWMENIGDNEFEDHILIQSLTYIYSFQLADLENDGDLDIFYCSAEGVGYFENLGEGNFSTNALIDEAVFGSVMCAIDLDQDGLTDLAMTTSLGEVVTIMNTGNGTFGNTQIVGESVSNIWAFASEDITGDGFPELFYSSVNFEVMDFGTGMFVNDGNGGFGSVQDIDFTGEYGRCIDFIDFDSDGDEDLFIVSQTGYISLYENIDGTLGDETILSAQEISSYWGEACDIDGDGDEDLLVTELIDGPFIYLFENVDGQLQGPTPFLTGSAAGGAPVIDVADLDNDGALDIIFSNYELDIIHWVPSKYSGCMDETACNYNENATIDSGQCCYEGCGCTDPNAFNFNPEATCSIPGCSYSINAFVYHDLLENGQFDPDDFPLSNHQFELQPGGDLYYSNSDGEIEMNLASGDYSLSIIPDGTYPFPTTAQTIEFTICENLNNDLDLLFGLSDEDTFFDIQYGVFSPIIHCNSPASNPVYIVNNGNVSIDLEVIFSFDDSLSLSGYSADIDSIVGNTAYFNVDLDPQESFFANFQFEPLSELLIGEQIDFLFSIDLYSQGQYINSYEDNQTTEVLCAYDPNDKRVSPEGHYDQNYIAEESELNYFIRFQNTGNAPATNVVVTDTISEFLDLNTISIVASSHDMNTNIDAENRVINFSFENIMLPDSTNNEPESHGFISFRIDANEGLVHNTAITNKANIYFDNNPPIITNETLSTIFVCDEAFEQFMLEDLEICSMDTLTFSSDAFYVDQFEWSFNGQLVGSGLQGTYIPQEPGQFDLSLNIINELCNISMEEQITVFELPEPVISQDMSILSSTSAESYQWYYNGVPIENSDSQMIEIETEGYYSVVVENEFGCFAESQEFFASSNSVNDTKPIEISIYPNPAKDLFTVKMGASNVSGSYRLINTQGQTIIEDIINNVSSLVINVNGIERGLFFIEILMQDGRRYYSKLILQ